MKLRYLTALGLFVAIGSALTAVGQETVDVKATSMRIQELQEERIDVLRQAVQMAMTQYSEGATSFKAVADLQRDLLEAQLDVAESREKRVALLQAQLKIAKAALELAEGKVKAGMVTRLDVNRAKSVAINVEIELLRLVLGTPSERSTRPR